jgi:hypothetical protein
MRRLLVVIAAGAFAWWLASRRHPSAERVAIGYADGSSLDVQAHDAAWTEALGLAREALRG